MDNLFSEHLQANIQKVSTLLESSGFDSLVIDAGSEQYYFQDDQALPFKSNPSFALFCPDRGPNHLLQITPGKKPRLAYYSPTDFWHEVSQLGSHFWLDEFEITEAGNENDLWSSLDLSSGRHCCMTPNPEKAIERGLELASDEFLYSMAWSRCQKSEYEIECIKEANRIGSKGHIAARDAFFEGCSEREIYFRYLAAANLLPHELPYGNIIALDEKAAILHYHKARDTKPGKVFLIDAGATFRGYCSDITRTYVTDDVHTVFKDLHRGIEKLQRNICVQVMPNFNYPDLHDQANRNIGQLLIDLGILKNITLEQAVENQLVGAFFPHGLGHPLGLQVHDVGGKQTDADGSLGEIDPRYPHLRTLRKIQPMDVLTVEPGCYFIETLLAPFREDSQNSEFFNWSLIDELKVHGGIRVEDNVVARPTGPENLTRPFLN